MCHFGNGLQFKRRRFFFLLLACIGGGKPFLCGGQAGLEVVKDLLARVHVQARLSAAKEQLTAAADAGQQQEAKAPQEMTVAELHAELDRQIAGEKKRAEGLSVSGPGSYEMATG